MTECGALPDKHRKRWGISECFVPGREEIFYPLFFSSNYPPSKRKVRRKETEEKSEFLLLSNVQ